MKPNRLIAAAALLGAISFAMPLTSRAEDHSMEAGAKEMYHGAKTDVRDAGITTKVKTALATNPVTKSYTIHVDTDNGVVNLTGNVPSPTVMKEAEQIAQSTEHVKSVQNNLKVDASSASGM